MARILVIEDNVPLRVWLCLILGNAGHEVAEASDGIEGVRAHHERQADLVICDLFMPEMDGLATIQELRRAWPSVPIVAMSGGPERLRPIDLLPVAETLGAVRTLPKPFSAAAVLAVVDDVLGHAARGPLR